MELYYNLRPSLALITDSDTGLLKQTRGDYTACGVIKILRLPPPATRTSSYTTTISLLHLPLAGVRAVVQVPFAFPLVTGLGKLPCLGPGSRAASRGVTRLVRATELVIDKVIFIAAGEAHSQVVHGVLPAVVGGNGAATATAVGEGVVAGDGLRACACVCVCVYVCGPYQGVCMCVCVCVCVCGPYQGVCMCVCVCVRVCVMCLYY
jgi:hypothetical protein